MRVRLRNPDRVERVDGPSTVAELLATLDLAPHTVLVVADGALVTASHELDDDAEVEIRPVISGGAEHVPQCARCRASAVIEEPRHRSAWCATHFVDHVARQVRKAIDHPVPSSPERMFSYADRLLVAVSGGKDSLALWEILVDLGYRVDGLYVGLGIGGYSARSREVCAAFAEERGLKLHVVDLAEEYGYTTPSGAQAANRPACGVCGLSKRYVFNRVAVEGGYDVMLTGHNLDDEAATLLGNVLRWSDEFLARQQPVLPATGPNQVRKCKPLFRLSERETAAYCLVRGIDYVVEECPLVEGNTGHELKKALDVLEAATPGVKAQLLFGFLERRDRMFADGDPATHATDGAATDGADAADGADADGAGVDGPDAEHALRACATCGMPTVREVCAFCRQQEVITARLTGALPMVGAGSSS